MYKSLFNNVFIPCKVDKIIEKEKLRVQKLLEQEVIEGDLNLTDSSIQSLSDLKYVGGTLWLDNTSLQSFNNLKYIGGDLQLDNSLLSKKFKNEEELELYIRSKR